MSEPSPLSSIRRPDPNCSNCDGRGCMGCVFREYDHECRDDCPFCCPTPSHGDVVVARFEGSGRVWPEGRHVRAGRVLKDGPAGGLMVRIFMPILEFNRETGEWEPSSVITCAETELEVVQ